MALEHLSASQVDTFGKCPERWRRRYIDGDKIPPGIAAHLGTGVHKAAEINHVQKIETREDLPLDVLADAAATEYDARLHREGLFLTRKERGQAPRLIGEGKDHAVALARLYGEAVAPTIQPLRAEAKVTLDDPTIGVPLLGYIDVLDTAHTVIDLKTSAKKWNQAQADSETQPTVYRQMVRAELGVEPGLRFDVMVKKKQPEHQALVTLRDESDWRAFASRAQSMVAAVRAGAFPGAPGGAWWCSERWCGYWGSCPFVSDRLRRLPNV